MPETNPNSRLNSGKSEVSVDDNGVNQQTQTVKQQTTLDTSEKVQKVQDGQEIDTEQPQAQDSASDAGSEHDRLDELGVVQAKLEEKEAQAKANYDLFVRERAELENFKRRMQREKYEALRFANEPLMRDLLPVVDNLERATAHAQGGGDGDDHDRGWGHGFLAQLKDSWVLGSILGNIRKDRSILRP